MKELSVFVDEAGVFGPYDHRDPYYILSFVFHNQDDDLSTEMSYFEENINELGFTNISIPKAMAFWLRPVLAYRLTPLGVFYLNKRWHITATTIAILMLYF